MTDQARPCPWPECPAIFDNGGKPMYVYNAGASTPGAIKWSVGCASCGMLGPAASSHVVALERWNALPRSTP